MKREYLLVPIIIFVILFFLIILSFTITVPDTTEQPITITGSQVLAKSIEEVSKEWENLTPVEVRVEVADSSNAIREVNRGGTDIAMLSRPISWAETTDYPDLVLTPIGYDAIAIVVSPSNRVLSLSEDQIRRIFSGELTDWEDVGGVSSKKINVLGREPGSTIRDFFRKTCLKTRIFSGNMQVYNSYEELIDALRGENNDTMITYFPVSKVPEDLRILSIKSPGESVINPSLESVAFGDYPYVRPLYLVTLPNTRSDVKALVNFTASPYGREILKKNGIIPLEKVEL